MHTNHYQFWPKRLQTSLTLPKTTLYENLVMSAKKYPDKTAIYFYGGTLRYQEIMDEIEKLAGYLENKLNVKENDKVLLFMQNSPQFLISFFAILRLRATVVPANPMSTTDDLDLYVRDCKIRHALVGQELYEKVAPLKETTSLERIIVSAYNTYIDENKTIGVLPSEVKAPAKSFPNDMVWKDALDQMLSPSAYTGQVEDVAVIPYTSGTTGLPKGCVHTNKTVQANTYGTLYWMNMTADTIALTTLPLFHVTGLVHSALAPIAAGSTMVLLTRWERNYAAKAIETYGCTHWINISTMLIDFLANPELTHYDISSLEVIGGGGATVPEAVGEQLYERTGLRYVEGYGLSETMSQTHFNPPDRPKMQCIGIPSFDVDARMLDMSTNKEVGVNEEGELVVNGPQLFEGYLDRDEENEMSHIQLDGKPFFRTGDVAKMDHEGYFYIVDRLKRMINAAGFKVWPTEVESILYKHPEIQQACVVAAPDEKRGETVKVFVILEEGATVTEKDIIEWSKTKMGAYKYPRMVEFRESFPTTSSGKVLWRQLQKEDW